MRVVAFKSCGAIIVKFAIRTFEIIVKYKLNFSKSLLPLLLMKDKLFGLLGLMFQIWLNRLNQTPAGLNSI